MMKLYAPITYWHAPPEERRKVCNGCGAKGGLNVPDTMYGLSVTDACDIHDWMTKYGKTLGDFYFAGAIFILNMTLVIISKSNWFTVSLRLARASKYFVAVMKYGLEHYWKDKKVNDNMSITYQGEFR